MSRLTGHLTLVGAAWLGMSFANAIEAPGVIEGTAGICDDAMVTATGICGGRVMFWAETIHGWLYLATDCQQHWSPDTHVIHSATWSEERLRFINDARDLDDAEFFEGTFERTYDGLIVEASVAAPNGELHHVNLRLDPIGSCGEP
ncbi:MAG: hypothetical protein AAF645_23850 [Myxococcota bacterium]